MEKLYQEFHYISSNSKNKIIERLISEYIKVSKNGGYYKVKSEDELRDKLKNCTGTYEMAYIYQPFSDKCPMSKIIDTMIIKDCLIQ